MGADTKRLYVGVMMLAVTACQSLSTPVPTEPPRVCLPAPRPEPLVMRPTPIKVISAGGINWFALDAKAYENLAANIQDMRKYLREQTAVIRHYEGCENGSLSDDSLGIGDR